VQTSQRFEPKPQTESATQRKAWAQRYGEVL